MTTRRLTTAVVAVAATVTAAGACGGPPPVVAAARRAVHDATAGDTSRDAAPPTAEDARTVGKLVQDYLRVRPAGIAPNPYWRSDEQRRFPRFDIAGVETYRQPWFRERYGSYRVEVAHAPEGAEPGTLQAIVHFVPRSTRGVVVPDEARIRLFARRERGAWRLGGALPQLTRTWPETPLGRIRYRVQPGIVLDTAMAWSGARYLDSVADAFGVTPPDEVLYVLTRSRADGLRVMGIDRPGHRLGGIHFGMNNLVVSAGGARDPVLRHELTHAALEGVGDPRLRQRLAVEGVATWMMWREVPSHEWNARTHVRTVLARRPALALEDVVRQRRNDADGDADPDAEAIFYPTGAWLVGRVHQAAGARGVRELLEVRERDPREFLAVARRHLRMSPRELDAAWREWTRQAGNTIALP